MWALFTLWIYKGGLCSFIVEKFNIFSYSSGWTMKIQTECIKILIFLDIIMSSLLASTR